MMGILNIASWGLLAGAVGQSLLFTVLFPKAASWLVLGPLLLPWLVVYTISFCKQAPFGPRRFRHCLIFAMCFYAISGGLAEILHIIMHPVAHEHISNTVARLLAYTGFVSFIVFIRACVQLRRLEYSQQEAHGQGSAV